MKTERLEKDIEAAFNRIVKRFGGDPMKFTSPGRSGVPDRVVTWPHGVTTWAELKKPGKGLDPLQEHEVGELLKRGHLAMAIRSEQDIARFVKASLERVMMAEATK